MNEEGDDCVSEDALAEYTSPCGTTDEPIPLKEKPDKQFVPTFIKMLPTYQTLLTCRQSQWHLPASKNIVKIGHCRVNESQFCRQELQALLLRFIFRIFFLLWFYHEFVILAINSYYPLECAETFGQILVRSRD